MEKFIYRFKLLKPFQVFTIFVRYALGAAFVWASVLKIKGIRFTSSSGEYKPIGTLPHLLETMYRSGLYWQFIGWGQFTAGFLIMSQTFSTIGAVMYLPIMLSIFVITTYFQATSVLVVTSLMLLANVYLLLWDWNRLKFILLPRPGAYIQQDTELSKQKTWAYAGIVLCAAIIIFRLITTRHPG